MQRENTYQITYTDAPEPYDGFGTRTIRSDVLEWGPTRLTPDVVSRKTCREVITPTEHVEWQRMRYFSGGYLGGGEDWLIDENGAGYITLKDYPLASFHGLA